jgi:hypothetical protein
MTWPTPILTTKSPRPTEESNLEGKNVRCDRYEGVGENILRALVIRLRGVLEPAGVLHGDGLALGRAGAAALSDDGLLDSHCCLSEGEVARLGKERVDSSGDASSARDGCKRERAHLGKRRGAWSFIR